MKVNIIKRLEILVIVWALLMSILVIYQGNCYHKKINKLNQDNEILQEQILTKISEVKELREDNNTLKGIIKDNESRIDVLEERVKQQQEEAKKNQISNNTTTTTKASSGTQTKANSNASNTTSTTNTIYQTDENGKYYEKTMRITCYCSCAKCCGRWAYNRPKDENGNDIVYTASGKRAVEKYTLGASTYYAFGTKIFVPGVGMCEVMDRGSGVKSNNHLDMYFSSHQAALNFGNKTLTCKIYV